MPRVRITWADLSNKGCIHLFGMPRREPLAGTDCLLILEVRFKVSLEMADLPLSESSPGLPRYSSARVTSLKVDTWVKDYQNTNFKLPLSGKVLSLLVSLNTDRFLVLQV